MAENKRYARLLQDALAMIDAEEYPRLYNCIADAIDGCGEPMFAPLEFVEAMKEIPHLPQIAWNLIIDILEAEVENGNADAMNDLGALYYGGKGCEQDYSKAVYYYNMAAEHGSRQAQENLGYCYYYGRNVPVDYEKAFHYFALGAFDGHLISLYKIGDMYANGYYVPKNEVEAFHIYEHCLEMMTNEAAPFVAGPVYLRLGDMFLNGRGTEENAKTALICYQKAEVFLYDMVKNGDTMYKKSLYSAVEGQAKARDVLKRELASDTAVKTALALSEYSCPNCNAILGEQKGFNPNLDFWICKKCGQVLFDEAVEGKEHNDTIWYCDVCGDMLNSQFGFTDVSGEWKCTKCGYTEKFKTIYDIRIDPSLFGDAEEGE